MIRRAIFLNRPNEESNGKHENNLEEDLRDPVEAAENSLSNFFHAR